MSSYAEFQEERNTIECPICYQPQSSYKTLPECYHNYCTSCLTQYIEYLIDTSQVSNITCPSCGISLLRQTILSSISLPHRQKYDKFLLREILLDNPYAKFCPQPDCEGYDMGSVKKKKLTCNTCRFEYCFFCVEKWHGSGPCSKVVDRDFEEWANQNNVKFCPKCKRRVEKRGGCPTMSCVCGNIWCWRCGNNPREPGHEIKCFLGENIWNLKKTIVFLMIFAPICIFFIPFLIFYILVDEIEEARAQQINRHRKIIYVLMFLLSPFIEIIGIVVFILVSSFLLAEKLHKVAVIFALPGFIIGVIVLSGICTIVITLSITLTFIVSIAGIVLLILRCLGGFLGKNIENPNYYPQTYD